MSDRSQVSDQTRPQARESSDRSLTNRALGNVGDRNTLSAMNTHKKGDGKEPSSIDFNKADKMEPVYLSHDIRDGGAKTPTKPGTASDSMPGKPNDAKTGTQPDSKPAKPGEKPGEKTATPGDPKPAKPGETKPGEKPGEKPATPGDSKPAKPGETKPGANPADAKPGTPSDSKPNTPTDTKPGAPGDAQPAKPGDPKPGSLTPQDEAALRKGTVHIQTTFPGSYNPGQDRQDDGTGFLVNAKGDSSPSKPGEQLIATADHVIEDRGDGGNGYQLGANLFAKKGDLSKADLADRGNELVSQAKPRDKGSVYVGKQEYAKAELSYLQQHFDDIKKVSGEVSPGSKGITRDGLDEYRRRNTSIDVQTQDGKHYSASIADREPGSDSAVLRINNLTPSQQQSMGRNQELNRTPPEQDQPVTSVGFQKIVKGNLFTVQQFDELKDTTPSLVTKPGLEHGMSGGPTRAQDGSVIGINHAGNSRIGAITPIQQLQPLLNEVESGKVPFRKNLD